MNLIDSAKAFFQGQDPDSSRLAGECRSEVEKLRSNSTRIADEAVWMNNIAALCGNTAKWDARTRSFVQANKATPTATKARLTVNKILPSFQNRLARLCKSLPKFDIPPRSMSEEDKDISRDAMDLVMHLWDDLRLQEKRIELTAWMMECGHAYLKACWDPTLGDMMSIPKIDPMTGEPVINPETGEPDAEIDWTGDVRAEVISAFEIFPAPLAKSWDEVKRSYLYHCKVRPLQYFVDNYEKGHLVKEESVWLFSLQNEQRINAMNTRGGGTGAANDEAKNSAIEIIKYEARSKKYPHGRMIISAGGILLENKELPAGVIPFAKFDDVKVGGKYNSESLITHARPIQNQYNNVVRKRAQWTNKLINGKYTAARSINLNQESLNDESAEVVFYDPIPTATDGGRPQPIPVPNIPQFAYTETDMLEKDQNEIFGLSDISRGTLPSASIPALGMQILQEADESRLGIVIEQNENAWADYMTILIALCSDGYKEPREIRVKSNNSYNYKQILGEKLKGLKALVVKGSTLPGSKVLKRQEILNAFDRGLLGPMQDPMTISRVTELIEFGDTQGLWEDLKIDKAQIKRVTDALFQGIPHISDEMDNHDLFIRELNKLRKGEKFDSIDPQIQALIIDAREQHLQWKMKLMGANVPAPVAPAHDPEATEVLPEEQVYEPTGQEILGEENIL